MIRRGEWDVFLSFLLGSTVMLCIFPPTLMSPSIPKKDMEDDAEFQIVTAVVTAYCPCSKCCGEYADGKTSTGTSAYVRGVAADPRRFLYGSRIDIPGYGISRIDDTGGAMRSSVMPHFDVRFPTHQEALNWGRKTLKVKVYNVRKDHD